MKEESEKCGFIFTGRNLNKIKRWNGSLLKLSAPQLYVVKYRTPPLENVNFKNDDDLDTVK